MTSDWFKKARNAPTLMTTYRVGLVQAKAFRILNMRTVEALEPYGIRPLDWALLGIVFERKEGISPSEIAEILGVKAPHVTSMMVRLKKKGLAQDSVNAEDRRHKSIVLTSEGKTFVPKVERVLRDSMRHLIKDASIKDMLAYVAVLSSIVENGND